MNATPEVAHPLADKVVYIARPAHQVSGLKTPLEKLGAKVFPVDVSQILPTSDFAALDECLTELASNAWVIFTSQNGVDAAADRLEQLGLDWPAEVSIAVVGAATFNHCKKRIKEPSAVPVEALGIKIPEVLGNLAGKKVLLLRGNLANPDLPTRLKAKGALVKEVEAYQTIPQDQIEIPDLAPDILALTSAFSAKVLLQSMVDQGKKKWLDRARIVCIGPETAKSVLELGFKVDLIASVHSMPGLISAIKDGQGVICG